MIGSLVAELRAILGAGGIATDRDELLHWGRDWTRAFVPNPCAVAWPRSTEQVVAVVNVCRQRSVAIVPSGGRTGLAAGAVATNGELVLSLDRMRAIGPVDAAGRTVVVEAGVPNQVLQEHCAPHGLWWPVELASKGSCTIGGNIATNAGGVRVIRYGHARQWVAGLDVVLASGEVLRLGGARVKDNSGTDLKHVFVGSEGTLGIVTRATLRLAPVPGPSCAALLAVDGLAAAVALCERVRRDGVEPTACEYFSAFCLERVLAHTGMPNPLPMRSTGCVLIERDAGDDAAAWLAGLIDAGLARDGVLAITPVEVRRLWAFRERITESLGADGAPHKNDVALPLDRLGAFAAAFERQWCTARPDWKVAIFGHLGDGNLHVNALRPSGLPDAAFAVACADADRALFELVRRHDGSLSAEHGIGLVKKPYLALQHGAAELAAMRAVKRAFDPQNLLNPGKIFDA
jgi:FAD/FMN-containing dehydrogenase